MCFTNSDRTNDQPPKPAQVPQRQSTTSKPPANASMGLHRQQSSDYAPPAGPPPSQNYAPPSGPPPSHSAQPSSGYAPPPGPPPSHGVSDYAPPSGPPPSHGGRDHSDFAPPPGPPPSHGASRTSDFAPPPGPPPSHQEYAPPPGPPPPSDDYAPPTGPPPSKGEGSSKHDWESHVPDTSLLPPPPDYFGGFDRSPANNATEQQAVEGKAWCRRFNLYKPLQVNDHVAEVINTRARAGAIPMDKPPFFKGQFFEKAVGVWSGKAHRAEDTCLQQNYFDPGHTPLYSAAMHNPIHTGRRHTIYYEVYLHHNRHTEVPLALGFVAPPYPPFRLPGWQRGSLAVHGDDGHRYINDDQGGLSFTSPFDFGHTVGIGMHLEPGNGGGISVEAFFTRDGKVAGSWNIYEELDSRFRDEEVDAANPVGVQGLQGFHDLGAAVGVFNSLEFDIVFDPAKWKWSKGRSLVESQRDEYIREARRGR